MICKPVDCKKEMNSSESDIKTQLDLLSQVVRGLTNTVQQLQEQLATDYNLPPSVNVSASSSKNVSAEHHAAPVKGATCAALWDDIDESNYCEYQSSSGKWYPCVYCEDVVRQMINTQFHMYKKQVEESTCKAQMRSLVAAGPPVWISDKVMHVEDGEHITKLWFSSSKSTISAKLMGALEGDERNELWQRYKSFYALLPEENDE